ncbi:hypothetical protein C7271_13345 [filamentous cyanobacterium CCP5]|nr:hypothetical protein C7271_13345 [filamentous cyanobacterium CCP5]
MDSIDPTPAKQPTPPSGSRWSPVLVGVWLAYGGYLFFSDWPPGPSLLQSPTAFLQEALDLSVNFWLVLPTVLPQQAPVINPVLEGLFNLVIAWALLFWGFWLDGRGQRWPIGIFLVGTAFLTNVFYLPWLALRHPHSIPPGRPLGIPERLGESRLLPLVLLGIVILSGFWAVAARPEFGAWGQRWEAFTDLLSRDRLAYSFICDGLLFWVFQGWLVPDDMARRQWHRPTALWTARLVPLVGLAVYLLWRPSIGPSQEAED